MGVVRRRQLKKVITFQRAMKKRSSVFFQGKYRVTPTLVTPLELLTGSDACDPGYTCDVVALLYRVGLIRSCPGIRTVSAA